MPLRLRKFHPLAQALSFLRFEIFARTTPFQGVRMGYLESRTHLTIEVSAFSISHFSPMGQPDRQA